MTLKKNLSFRKVLKKKSKIVKMQKKFQINKKLPKKKKQEN